MGRILAVILSLAVLAASLTLLAGPGRGDGLVADAPVHVPTFA